IAQVPIYTFPVNTYNYYVSGGNGVQLFVEEKGNPEMTTIVFTSGYLGTRNSWEPQWTDSYLSKKFHLVRWDCRGLGKSGKPNEYSLKLHSDDLAAVIAKVKSNKSNKKIVLVGWSYGSLISLKFMQNYPDIEVHGFISIVGLVNFKFEPAIEFTNVTTILKNTDDFTTIVSAFTLIYEIISAKTLSDELKSLMLDPTVDLSNFFSNLNIPTLNIIGAQDRIAPFSYGLYYAGLAKRENKLFTKNVDTSLHGKLQGNLITISRNSCPMYSNRPSSIYTFPVNTYNYYVSGGNGVQLFVEEKGNLEMTTIVHNWEQQWTDPYLSKKFHLVRWDCRGLGKSGKPNEYSLKLHSDDLAAVVSKVLSNKSNKKIVLVGWSYGSAVSLTFMQNYPDIEIHGFISVVGVNISAKPLSDELKTLMLGTAVLASKGYRETSLFDLTADLSNFFSDLNIPTLNIIGAQDRMVPFSYGLYYAGLAKRENKIIYEECGHLPQWEVTRKLNYDISKFVSNV
ncbi:183_t:CDS:2, partial [Funneliformis mosseae]